jgi:histidinol-phosphate aminotransferase
LHAELNRYPDAKASALKAQLRAAMGVPEAMDLILGNGSDELIQMLALAVARPGAVMLGFEPSFVMFRMIATLSGMQYAGVLLNDDFTLDLQRTLKAIDAHQPALIFIAYPNNPTANLFDVETVERIIESAPGIVVIDEAYHPFADATFMSRLGEFPNLLVMRTLSKMGLAGLRLGLLAGPSAWLGHVDKVRLPYNVNVLTQVIATEVLQHRAALEMQAANIRAERSRVLAELRRMQGVMAHDSDANFILFKIDGADRIFAALRQRGILIKNLSGAHPLLANALRVTVGTPEENTRFLSALQATLAL